MHTHEKMMADLQRLLKSQNFKTAEEAESFIKQMTQHTIPSFEKEALSIEEQAEDLVMEAYELDQEGGLDNVLDALELDPECIMGYEYLGNLQPLPQLAIPYYAYGVQIGREKYKQDIEESKGEVWYVHHLRPFLRCLNNYANCLYALGSFDKSLATYKESLELNTNDNMGVRYVFGAYLLAQNKLTEFEKLDKDFEYEDSTMCSFNRVLYSFLKTGESDETLKFLTEAKSKNKFVIGILTSKSPKDNRSKPYAMGSKEEAHYYASIAYGVWQELNGAVEFLKKHKK
jgi:tetratricopeptide (TPR) repeat protein